MTTENMIVKNRFLRSFARRKGRSFTEQQKYLIQNLLPKYSDAVNKIIEAKNLKPNINIHLEIGFGRGEHVLELTSLYPNDLIVGCEVFLNGLVALLPQLVKNPQNNLILYNDDGRNLLEQLPHDIIHTTYVLFPDPWQKAKHNKRRLINKYFLSFLAQFSRKLIFATDHENYAMHVLTCINALDGNSNQTLLDKTNAYKSYKNDMIENHIIDKNNLHDSLYSAVILSHSTIIEYNYNICKNIEDCKEKNIVTNYAKKALQNNKEIHYFEVNFNFVNQN